MHKLIIIYYHEVVEENEGYSYQKIEKAKFDEQMKFLHDNGYQTITFEDLDKPLPDKAVIVSFDDGFRTVYDNAYSIMRKYDIKGSVYLPTAFIGNDEKFLTWDMISEMNESGKWYFSAHTHNHVDIRNITETNDEIKISNEMLCEKLGYTPTAFCMPFGGYSRKSVRLIRNRGNYKYMLSSCYGRVSESKLQKSVLPRIGISNDDTIDIFKKKLNGGLDWKGPLQRLRMVIYNLQGQRFNTYEY